MLDKLIKAKVLNEGSIVKKIIACYLIVLLMLCAVNISFYCIIKDRLVRDEIRSGEDTLISMSTIMDQKLYEIHTQSYNFLSNGDNIERMRNIDAVDNQYRLCTELNHILVSTKIADKIFLHSLDKATVCSDEGIYGKYSFLCEEYGWNNKAMQKFLGALESDKNFMILSPSEFLDDGDSSELSMIIATSIVNSSNTFRLIITVSKDGIGAIFGGGNGIPSDMYIVNDKGTVLLYTGETDNSGEVMHSIADSRAKRGRISAGSKYVLWNNSDSFRVRYIKFIHEKEINAIVNRTSIILIFECILLMIIGIAALPMLLKFSYMPIYNILCCFRNMFGDESEISDEYTYIINGLERIHSRLDADNGRTLLYDWLNNNCYHEEIDAMFEKEYFMVADIRLRDDKMSAAFGGYMKNCSDDIKYLPMGKCRYAIIINGDSELPQEYTARLKTISDDIYKLCGDRIFVAASDVLGGADRLNLLYKRAIVAGDNGLCKNVGCVFEYSGNIGQIKSDINFSEAYEEQLADEIKNGSGEGAYKCITDLFDKNTDISYYALEILKMRLLNLYFRFGMFDFDEGFFRREYLFGSIREQFAQMFMTLARENGRNFESVSKLQTQIVEYIDNNYRSAVLNIDMVAAHLNLSVPYMSKIFKQVTGETFKDYLMNKRVTEAKRLMSETNMSIKEISEAVGAGTYNSFIRMFKNKVGVSPGRYKSMSSGKTEE